MADKRAIRRGVTVLLFVALLISLMGVAYVAVNPPPATEPFTEFYVLGPDGNATDYPTNLTTGESGTVIAGVTNHEHETVDYDVELRLSNRTAGERSVTLDDGGSWERSMSFTAREPGKQKLQLLLYRDGTTEPYRTARLWIDVSA